MLRKGKPLALLALGAILLQGRQSFAQTSFVDWLERAQRAISQQEALRSEVPPSKVTVRWKARPIWKSSSLQEVLAMRGEDLNEDGKDELVLLTPTELLVFSHHRGLVDLRGKTELAGALAGQASRDPIGSLAIRYESEGWEVFARSSEKSEASRYQWKNMNWQLVAQSGGYPVCVSGNLTQSPGRNYFAEQNSYVWEGEALRVKTGLVAADCSSLLKGADGKRLRFWGEVDLSGELVLGCAGPDDYCGKIERSFSGVGDAHLIADIDQDGYPEVFTAGTAPRGQGDELVVYSLRDFRQRIVFERSFPRGIMAMAVGDFDGDQHEEAVVAVRAARRPGVQLWLLN